MEKDAVELIEEATKEPTLDELARRARRVAALAAPTEAELHEQVAFWRASRVTWGQKAAIKKDGDEE